VSWRGLIYSNNNQMASITHQEIFEKFVSDWSILNPDLCFQRVISVLACAILCCQKKCLAINILPNDVYYLCQLSKKKGSSMEKNEAFTFPGTRMYQRKVITCRN
jgi:hypothetical protein